MQRPRASLTGLPPPADAAAAARLIEDFTALGRTEARFAASRAGLAALQALGGNAPYLAGLALREPDILIGTTQQSAAAMLTTVMATPRRPRDCPGRSRRAMAR
ncbi:MULTISPECIES: hypothetical protein [Acidiphilium]|uniref:hypothetical protein n=1 Tax=Acidiphilium TaxID=522 RepID=UPI00257A1B22|nr:MULTISPECIES: hypothetical protein [Acidiphilium]HQT84440.1 hypothetical protein [Acidiphilium rubrum]